MLTPKYGEIILILNPYEHNSVRHPSFVAERPCVVGYWVLWQIAAVDTDFVDDGCDGDDGDEGVAAADGNLVETTAAVVENEWRGYDAGADGWHQC